MPSRARIVAPRSAGVTGRSAGCSPRRSEAADDAAPPDAAAGEEGRVAGVPVVAAGPVVDLRRAAELAHGDDQGRVQQAAVVQVVEQGREGPVEHPAVAVLHDLEVAVVHVPAAVARVLGPLDVRAPVDLDERDARLDQPAGDQAALAEAVRPVRLADPGRLALDVERGQALAARRSGCAPGRSAAPAAPAARRPIALPGWPLESCEQVPARPEPRGADALGERRRRAASGRRPARSRAGTGRTCCRATHPPRRRPASAPGGADCRG